MKILLLFTILIAVSTAQTLVAQESPQPSVAASSAPVVPSPKPEPDWNSKEHPCAKYLRKCPASKWGKHVMQCLEQLDKAGMVKGACHEKLLERAQKNEK